MIIVIKRLLIGYVPILLCLWGGVMGTNAQSFTGLVNELNISPDSNYVAFGLSGGDGRVIVSELNTQIDTTLRSGNIDPIISFAWSPNSQFLASGDISGLIEIWDINTMQMVQSFMPTSAGPSVESLDWFQDGTSLLAVYEFNAVLWNPLTGAEIQTFETGGNLDGALSSDNQNFVVSKINAFEIWDIVSNSRISRVDENSWFGEVAWSPTNDKFVLVGEAVNPSQVFTLAIRDATDGSVIQELESPQGILRGSITSLHWTADNRYIFTGSLIGLINVWNAENGEFVRSISNIGGIYGLDILPSGDEFILASAEIGESSSTIANLPVPLLGIHPLK